MKITCHACDAKYTIADEKVTGRTVKIKCKKCGATIVVNADTAAAPQMGGAAGAPYGDAQPQAPAGDDDGLMATRVAGMDGAPPAVNAPEWTVSMTGEDERQMSQLQIAEEMQRGTITGDTYVWRDGMSDWLPVAQIPDLQALLARVASAGHAAHAPAHAPAPVHEENHGLAGTIVMNEGGAMSPFAAPRPAAGMAAAPAPAAAPVAATPAPLAAVNQPTAARRANRAGASVDVFAAAQETREHGDRPRPPTPAGKLGERNENSVLFSLSALTATENAASKSKPEDSPFDLGLGNGKGGGGGNSFDDLMNIGGGAIGGPMLAPPPLLAPVVEPPPAPVPVQPMAAPVQAMGAPSPMMSMPAPPPKSKTGLIIGIVAAVAVLGGIGAVVALGGGGSSSDASGQASVPTAQSSAPATTASAAPTPTVSSGPATTEAPATSGAPVASNAVGSGDSGGKTPTGVSGTPTGKTSSSPSATPTASAKASSEPTPTPAPTATAAADPGSGGRDFNKGAATTALSAAAGRAKGCKTADGPTGSASVRVVFAPSGNVTSANVQGPPFAGTPVGGCIASAFRGASVPPFDGSPVAVSKTVNIN